MNHFCIFNFHETVIRCLKFTDGSSIWQFVQLKFGCPSARSFDELTLQMGGASGSFVWSLDFLLEQQIFMIIRIRKKTTTPIRMYDNVSIHHQSATLPNPKCCSSVTRFMWLKINDLSSTNMNQVSSWTLPSNSRLVCLCNNFKLPAMSNMSYAIKAALTSRCVWTLASFA